MISEADARKLLADVDVVDQGIGPVVALAHGAGGGVRENFAPFLSDFHHRWVGPYYPGAGNTPPATEPLDIEQLADQVVAAGVRAGSQRFPIVGLSLGAAVATTAAVRHPDHVSALVLTVGLVHADAQTHAVAQTWRALVAAGADHALAEFLLHVSFADSTLATLDTDAHAGIVEQIRRDYPEGGLSHLQLVERTDIRMLLPHVATPALVIVAGRDRIVLPETVRQYEALPNARLIEYPEAGHIFNPAEGERWKADTTRFLDEHFLNKQDRL